MSNMLIFFWMFVFFTISAVVSAVILFGLSVCGITGLMAFAIVYCLGLVVLGLVCFIS